LSEELKVKIPAQLANGHAEHRESLTLAWDGYLAALLEWTVITVRAHQELVASLLTVADNPVNNVFLGRDLDLDYDIEEKAPFQYNKSSDPFVTTDEQTIAADTWYRVKEEIRYFEGALPRPVAIVWAGYVAGLLDSGLITHSSYTQLRSLLPVIEDDPIPHILSQQRD
jgi:hypothetical protein